MIFQDNKFFQYLSMAGRISDSGGPKHRVQWNLIEITKDSSSVNQDELRINLDP